MSKLSVGTLEGLLVNSNVISVPSGHTLKQPGSIIQVQATDYTGTASSTSATPADVSGFAVTITPKLATSKILVYVSVALGFGNDAYPYILVKRNGTSIGTGTGATGAQINTFISGAGTNATGSTEYKQHQYSKMYLDSPATTSSLTYQIQLASPYNSIAGYINRQGNQANTVYTQWPTSSIVVFEVAQ